MSDFSSSVFRYQFLHLPIYVQAEKSGGSYSVETLSFRCLFLNANNLACTVHKFCCRNVDPKRFACYVTQFASRTGPLGGDSLSSCKCSVDWRTRFSFQLTGGVWMEHLNGTQASFQRECWCILFYICCFSKGKARKFRKIGTAFFRTGLLVRAILSKLQTASFCYIWPSSRQWLYRARPSVLYRDVVRRQTDVSGESYRLYDEYGVARIARSQQKQAESSPSTSSIKLTWLAITANVGPCLPNDKQACRMVLVVTLRSLDSVVGIATGYRLDDQGVWVRILVG